MQPGGFDPNQQPQYSNYPRPGMGFAVGGFREPRREIDLGAIGEAWDLMFKNLGPSIGLAALSLGSALLAGGANFLLIILFFPSMMTSQQTDLGAIIGQQLMSTLIGLPISIISYGVTGLLAAGACSITLKLLRGQPVGFGDAWEGMFKNAGSVFALGIIIYLGVTLGIYLCIIPGVILAGLCFVAIPVAVDRGIGPFQAIKESASLMTKNLLMACAMVVLCGLIVVAGAIACILPMFLMQVLCSIIQTVVYEDVREDHTPAYQPVG